MKKILQTFFTFAQISVIVFAVIISVVRLGVQSLEGYEPDIEDWFEHQGIQAEISKLSVRVEGLKPEITIRNFVVTGEDSLSYEIARASLHVDLLQSLLKQQIIVDSARFNIDKIVLDSRLLGTAENSGNPQLFVQLTKSLKALHTVSVSIDDFVLIDSKKNRYRLNQTNLSLKGHGHNKSLEINAWLPQQNSPALNARFDIDLTQLTRFSDIKGSGFIALNVHSLKNLSFFVEHELAGAIEINNWIEFEGKQASIISKINANDVAFTFGDSKHVVTSNSVLVSETTDQTIHVSMENKKLLLNDHDFSQLQLTSTLSLNSEESKHHILFEKIDVKKTADLLSMVPEIKDTSQFIQHLKPSGFIEELFIQTSAFSKLDQADALFKAKDIQWSAHAGIPSVKHVSINAAVNQQHFTSIVDSQSLTVLIPEIFSHPFDVDQVSAVVNGQFNKDQILINIPTFSAKHHQASVQARASLNIENNKSPYLFLRLNGQNASIKTVEPFLPQILMDDEVLDWVKKSVKKATVQNADVIYAGRLENDVNFDVKNNGVFDTWLNLENVDLQYDVDWPNVTSEQALLRFKNYQLHVKSEKGSSVGLNANDVEFSIENLDSPVAELTLQVDDVADKQWGFVKNSPIKELIPYYAGISQVKGRSKTAVSVEFPLTNLTFDDVILTVDIAAEEVGFNLDDLAIEMDDISGDIQITENNIIIKPLAATWYGHPVAVKTMPNNDRLIHLNMTAKSIEAKHLLHNLPIEFNRHIEGASDWTVDIQIDPTAEDNQKETHLAKITAHSNLKNTKINLPAPFSLEKETTVPFTIELDLFQSNDIELHLIASTLYEVKSHLTLNELNHYDLISANVQLGVNKSASQISSGVQINGVIDELNIDHWKAYLAQSEDVFDINELDVLSNIELKINELTISGVTALETQLTVEKVDNGLVGLVASSITKGSIFIPIHQPKEAAIDINLDFLDIEIKPGLGDDSKETYQTNSIPNLQFNSKLLSVNGYQFEDVSFDMISYIDHYFELKSLRMKHNDINLVASGSWDYLVDQSTHESTLNISIQGDDIGSTLNDLGLVDTIENGKVSFKGELKWPAEFWKLDFEEAVGNVKLRLTDGYLLNAEPGGGRFVGLLSLSALPRRLTLDFSDFFKKGLEFDRISGDFSIHDGSMWTDNLKMRGAATDVVITGRTGLKAKDYDQVITVIPQIRDTLPVLGSLISGSSVGWAMLLLQKVFEDPIDESVSIKYKVTGLWEEPIIEVIEKPKVKTVEEDQLD